MERRLSDARRVPENHTQAPIVSVEKLDVPNVTAGRVTAGTYDVEREEMHRTGRVPRTLQFFKTDAF